MNFKSKLMATLVAVIVWTPTVDASPIDDASKYSVRIKSNVRSWQKITEAQFKRPGNRLNKIHLAN